MATNMRRHCTRTLTAAATDPTTPASGDPALIGQIPVVTLVKEGEGGNAATDATFALDGSFMLSVKGVDGSGNSAVAVGDLIYYVTADTPKLSKKATGVLFGAALGTVSSGGTSTIEVLLPR